MPAVPNSPNTVPLSPQAGLSFSLSSLRHKFLRSFAFHVPGPPSRQVPTFLKIVSISALLNSITIFAIILADSKGWVDRSNWEGWGGMVEQTPVSVGCESSAPHVDDYMAQPITSLSNLGFTFTGVIILQFAVLDVYHNGIRNLAWNRDVGKMRKGHFISSYPVLSLTLSFLLGFMCYTSFCWHASLTVKGGKMDMSTIYLLCIYLFGLCGVRLLTYVNFRSPVLLAVLVNSTNGGALYLGYKTYKKNQEEGIKEWEMFTIMLVLGVVGGAPLPLFIGWARMGKNAMLGWWLGGEWSRRKEEIRGQRPGRRRSWGLAILGLICIASGGGFRKYDQTWMCSSWFGPNHWFQAHAVWHVMCAFAILYLYLFFRSEVFNLEGYGVGGGDTGEEWEERKRKSVGRTSSGEGGGVQMELYIVDRKSSGEGIGEIL